MESYFLIFPIHLFKDIKKLEKKKVYLIEEPRFFIDFKYHKLKIAYHRATMKSYYDYLKLNKIDVIYIEFNENINKIYSDMNKNIVFTYDLCDNVLKNKLKKYIPNIIVEETLNFLVNEKLLKDNLHLFYKKKYNHKNFYKWQRERLNILIDKDGNPKGGKWSFDSENRKKLPQDINIPKIKDIYSKYNNLNEYINEAKNYTIKHFKNNYGSLDYFIYPIDHNTSKEWLIFFLKDKFENFGKYEDAESERDPFLFHSVLTPMMNIGLLTDTEVIDITLKYENKIPISSFEGFVRQIIGWRNYIYTIYLLEGDKMKNMNFFNHKNKINNNILWEGNTEIIPIDNIIKKIVNFGYAHHIERLMYLGNYLLICMINPNDIYKIFMEWTIDAYEWVMIPNVYSMSQFADEGLMMSRPYISSSNYILKMSDYKEASWCKIYDALYYNFINTHEEYLASNYATSRQVAFWRKKNNKDKKEILELSKTYLKKYF